MIPPLAERHETWLQADVRLNSTLALMLVVVAAYFQFERGPGLAAGDPVLIATLVTIAACIAENAMVLARGRRLLRGTLVPLVALLASALAVHFNHETNVFFLFIVQILAFMRFRLQAALAWSVGITVATIALVADHWSSDPILVLRTLFGSLLANALLGIYAHASQRVTAQRDEVRFLLRSALDTMAQGLAVFGRDGRVRLLSDKLLRLFDAPAEWSRQSPTITQFIAHLSAAGHYDPGRLLVDDETRRLIVNLTPGDFGAMPRHFVRRTADNRYFDVESHLMASGDLVMTYTDVTAYELSNRQFQAVLTDYDALRQRELDRSREKVVDALIMLAGYRDDDTGRHILRTQLYVELLAGELVSAGDYIDQLSEEAVTRMVKAAPMHDLGKIGVPDQVLLKNGRLDAQEQALMRLHPAIGETTLLAAARDKGGPNSLLAVAARMAGGHHEHWDGTGYPRGIAGHQIPLEARLMGVADVYDALTTPRVYKLAWSHEDACAEIARQRGAHFDPLIVDAFQRVAERFRDIADRYRDTLRRATS